jgi:hypothetical protein
MNNCIKAVASIGGALMLVACAKDFVVGDWVGQLAMCTDGVVDQLTIGDDLTGTGTLVVGCDADVSLACPASINASKSLTKSGSWQLQADFTACDAVSTDLGRRYKDCQENGTDQLRCCNPDGSGCLTYARQ